MAYEKYTWVDGEVITAQKLNHIEGGVEANSGGTKIKYVNYYYDYNEDPSNVTCDNTYAEVKGFLDQGYFLIAKVSYKPSGAPYARDFYMPMSIANTTSNMITYDGSEVSFYTQGASRYVTIYQRQLAHGEYSLYLTDTKGDVSVN